MCWHSPCFIESINNNKEDETMARTYLDRFMDPWQEFDRMSRLFNGSLSNG